MKKIFTLSLLLIAFVGVSAQSKAELKKLQDMQTEVYISNLVTSGTYQFYACGGKSTTGTYIESASVPIEPLTRGLRVTPDKIMSDLPFTGTSSSAMFGNTESPLTYTSDNVTFEVKPLKKNKRRLTIVITCYPNNSTSTPVKNTLDIYPNGAADLWVDYPGLSGMKFTGSIAEYKPGAYK